MDRSSEILARIGAVEATLAGFASRLARLEDRSVHSVPSEALYIDCERMRAGPHKYAATSEASYYMGMDARRTTTVSEASYMGMDARSDAAAATAAERLSTRDTSSYAHRVVEPNESDDDSASVAATEHSTTASTDRLDILSRRLEMLERGWARGGARRSSSPPPPRRKEPSARRMPRTLDNDESLDAHRRALRAPALREYATAVAATTTPLTRRLLRRRQGWRRRRRRQGGRQFTHHLDQSHGDPWRPPETIAERDLP